MSTVGVPEGGLHTGKEDFIENVNNYSQRMFNSILSESEVRSNFDVRTRRRRKQS